MLRFIKLLSLAAVLMLAAFGGGKTAQARLFFAYQSPLPEYLSVQAPVPSIQTYVGGVPCFAATVTPMPSLYGWYRVIVPSACGVRLQLVTFTLAGLPAQVHDLRTGYNCTPFNPGAGDTVRLTFGTDPPTFCPWG